MYPDAPVTRQRSGEDISQVSHAAAGTITVEVAICAASAISTSRYAGTPIWLF
jgi:hypothetical protein